MRFDATLMRCASIVAVAGAALLTSCSAAPTAAPFDPGAAPAATARAEATAVAAAQQTQIAAPAATAAYQAESDSLDNRERALRLSEQEHALVVQQQQDAIALEQQRALIPPMATRVQADANTQVSISQAAGALPIVALVVVVAAIVAALAFLFHFERAQRERANAEEERRYQERARRIEAEARALAPREPVPGVLQIYNVQAAMWVTQMRPAGTAHSGVVVEAQASLPRPEEDHARRHRWHRALFTFARHIERRQASNATSRRLMKVDGVCEEDAWNTFTDALAKLGAMEKRQGVTARLAPEITATYIRDQLATGYWSLPPDLYEVDPPDVSAVVSESGHVEVEALPA